MAENIVRMPLTRRKRRGSTKAPEPQFEGDLGELLRFVQRLLAEGILSAKDVRSLNRASDLKRALGLYVHDLGSRSLRVRCMEILASEGLSESAVGHALRDSDFREQLRVFWESREEPTEIGSSPGQRKAQAILGTDCFVSPCEAAGIFGFPLSRDWYLHFSDIPFDEAQLRGLNGFVVLPDLGLSILEMYERCPQGFWAPSGLGIQGENFAGVRGNPGWRAIRKEVLKYSWGHTWALQNDIVASKGQNVPDARLTVYSLLLARAANKLGDWAPDIGVRTSTTTPDGGRVYVYMLPDYGCLLGIERHGEAAPSDQLGVIAALANV